MPHQIVKNPSIEVCFFKEDFIAGRMLRVSGEIEFLTSYEIKERVLRDRPHLEYFQLTADSPVLVVFRIAHGEAYAWRLNTCLRPKEYIKF